MTICVQGVATQGGGSPQVSTLNFPVYLEVIYRENIVVFLTVLAGKSPHERDDGGGESDRCSLLTNSAGTMVSWGWTEPIKF